MKTEEEFAVLPEAEQRKELLVLAKQWLERYAAELDKKLGQARSHEEKLKVLATAKLELERKIRG